MFILKTGHQPGVYVPLRALFLVVNVPREALRQSKSQFDGQNSARQAETLIG